MTISRSLFDPNFLARTKVGPLGVLKVGEVTRIVGAVFSGAALDTGVWATTLANGGTVVQGGGEGTLATNTTANGSAILTSLRTARYTSGTSNFYRAIVQLGDTGTATNVRRWGAFTATDGAFFQLNGTTFSIVSRKNSVDTVVTAFNGTPFTVDTNVHAYEIHYTPLAVYFTVDDVLLHVINAAATPWSATLHLQARLENTNSAGSAVNVSLKCRLANITRFGSGIPRAGFTNVSANGTLTLKSGPGTLSSVIINTAGSGGATLTIYDNITAAGSIIAVINLAAAVTTFIYGLDFSVGLTIVSTNTPGNFTVVYE